VERLGRKLDVGHDALRLLAREHRRDTHTLTHMSHACILTLVSRCLTVYRTYVGPGFTHTQGMDPVSAHLHDFSVVGPSGALRRN